MEHAMPEKFIIPFCAYSAPPDFVENRKTIDEDFAVSSKVWYGRRNNCQKTAAILLKFIQLKWVSGCEAAPFTSISIVQIFTFTFESQKAKCLDVAKPFTNVF